MYGVDIHWWYEISFDWKNQSNKIHFLCHSNDTAIYRVFHGNGWRDDDYYIVIVEVQSKYWKKQYLKYYCGFAHHSSWRRRLYDHYLLGIILITIRYPNHHPLNIILIREYVLANTLNKVLVSKYTLLHIMLGGKSISNGWGWAQQSSFFGQTFN